MIIVIADTSCLITYDKINGFDILKKTFNEIIITKEVAEEYGHELPNWIVIKSYDNKKEYTELRISLGKGEASSIVLAKELEGSLLIIDEKRGRKIARKMSVNIIGSLGILLKAKAKGVINSVGSVIEKIETETNFRIANSIKEELLKRAKE